EPLRNRFSHALAHGVFDPLANLVLDPAAQLRRQIFGAATRLELLEAAAELGHPAAELLLIAAELRHPAAELLLRLHRRHANGFDHFLAQRFAKVLANALAKALTDGILHALADRGGDPLGRGALRQVLTELPLLGGIAQRLAHLLADGVMN